MRVIGSFLVWVLAVVGVTCMWDSDTLAQELKGLPGVADVVAGRIDRNPDLYYEMRLARVSAEISAGAIDLGLYDDAGVACDRLGRGDEAIEWMEKKALAMEGMVEGSEEWDEAEYRRLANLGTFLVHQWLRAGKDMGELGDIEKGLEALNRALEINPEAHFGRERVQVMLIEHMVFLGKEDAEKSAWLEAVEAEDTSDLREGIIGMMAMGEGWESVELHMALLASLDYEDGVAGHLLQLKIDDLQRDRGGDIDELKVMQTFWGGKPVYRLDIENAAIVKKAYLDLKANGQEFGENRERFMMAKLERGEHPDTDKDFWDGYVEVENSDAVERYSAQMGDPHERVSRRIGQVVMGWVIGIGVVLAGIGFLYFWIDRNKSRV